MSKCLSELHKPTYYVLIKLSVFISTVTILPPNLAIFQTTIRIVIFSNGVDIDEQTI